MLVTLSILENISPYLEPVLQAIRQDNVSPQEFFWGKNNIADHYKIQSFEVEWKAEYGDDDFEDYLDRSTAIIDVRHFKNDELMFPLLKLISRDVLLSVAHTVDEQHYYAFETQQFRHKTGKGTKIPLQNIRAFLDFKYPEAKDGISPEDALKFAEHRYRHTSTHDGDNKISGCRSMDAIVAYMNGVREQMLSTDIYAHKELCVTVEEYLTLSIATSIVESTFNVLDIFQIYKDQIIAIILSNSQRDIYGREDFRKVEPLISRLLGAKRNYSKDMIAAAQFYMKSGGNIRVANDGREFEGLCKKILMQNGWKVSSTSASSDYGGDLIAERDELRWCIQCKDTGKPAGVSSVQQAVAGTAYYSCDYAVVVSRNGFTSQAVLLASKTKVFLTNENGLDRMHLMI